jgi:murein DD-endopeptidase MepM/ murein hydrolase activator NlpD
MVQKRRRREKSPASNRKRSTVTPVGRHLRRPISIIGAMALAACATIGSAYPKQAETIVPRTSNVDAVALVRDLANLNKASAHDSVPAADSASSSGITDSGQLTAERSRDAEPRSPVAMAIEDDGLFGTVDPKLIRALRMDSVGETEDRLYRHAADPLLRLVSLTPPYTLSSASGYQTRLAYVSGSIEHSLFEAGQAAGLSHSLISKLTQIFGGDIDFALDVRAGDSFSVVYEQKYWFGRKIAEGPILAAEFVNQGQAYRTIGFRNESGRLVYYTPTGRNMRQAFLRKPVKFSRISSRFSLSRFHPILKMWLPHLGVDYAAPTGTPVRATAAGTVVSVGWDGGYGRMILLDHGGGYRTAYAHLSRYRTGLHVGAHVEQSEVIGYVGRSGLATGPHLHYELRVNGQHRNPLTYHFPGGDSVAPEQRAQFLHAARVWVAQLDRMSDRYVASR